MDNQNPTPKLIKVIDEQKEELILEFDKELECEICVGEDKVTKGTYKVSGGNVEIGFCMSHVKKVYGTYEEIK